MKKVSVLLAAAMFLGLPMVASAGIVGDCVDCHTMHNSEQGAPVAMKGTAVAPSATPNQNLLRMDCIACHAQDPTGGTKIVTAAGGSVIPQVAHADASGNLAGGNFSELTTGGDRKGHNIVDFFAADADNLYKAPGDYSNKRHDFGGTTVPLTDNTVASAASTAFTCAGAVGCHGTRSQMLSGYTDPNNTIDLTLPANNATGADGPDFWVTTGKRQGIAAITGAHHNNSDDEVKNPAQNAIGYHDGEKVAAGYRFIPGLKGMGNPTERWQNNSPTSHNEYFGSATNPGLLWGTSTCNACHIEGTTQQAGLGGSNRMTLDSTLGVPNQSMSGFCVTCHGEFHSSGTGADRLVAGGKNGTSGAFLRHPSDHVIPNAGEYAAYTNYDVTAPVARPVLASAVSDAVVPGTDLVMCLSCHVPHASEFDGMLRFDYALMTAGNFADIPTAQAAGGCMACHTTKGVLPANR